MDFWESFEIWTNKVWLHVYYFCNGNQLILNVFIPLLIMMIIYWSTSAFFAILDLTGKPRFLIKFRIPDSTADKYPRVDESKLRQVASQVLFNQTVVAIPVIYFCYLLKCYRGYDQAPKLPKFHKFVFDFIIQILVEEIFFYYSHRLLHHPLFYKRFHKKHHEWTSPIGMSAIYCHPVEHAISNVFSTFVGSVIAGMHCTSLWGWLAFATAYGVIVHSGYHLPLTPTPEFHHYHHQKFNENFGVAGILDWLHGTDKEFRKTKAFERNVVLFSLTPLRSR